MNIFIPILIIFILLLYLYYENTELSISRYSIESDKIPSEFDKCKIAQISDFHNTNSKKIQNSVIENLKKERPNIIVITGDYIDAYKPNIDICVQFIDNIKDIAPIYYVTGNHESRVDEYGVFKEKIQQMGVYVVENEKYILNKDGASIEIVCIQDPSFYVKSNRLNEKDVIVDGIISNLIQGSNNYKILLCHRPELFSIYSKNNIDLVFTGHAHGGQIRLPKIGGLFAPNQGFFPKYTKGVYTKDNTNMIVSAGIGKSRFPFRINNRPQLVIVTLEKIYNIYD